MASSVVTYETLREIQRNEKKGERLYNLDDSFYFSVKSYLDKRGEAEDEMSKTEVMNANFILRDIVDRREKKILNQALMAVRANEKADLGSMTSREKELFNSLVNVLTQYRNGLENSKVKVEEIIEKPRVKVKKKTKTKKETARYLKVKILEDLPEIVGSDLENYGPFKKEQIVKLPTENANIFIENNKAELVKK